MIWEYRGAFVLISGLLAALLWLASSLAWVWALRVKLYLGPELANDPGHVFSLGTGENGEGEFIINGIEMPTYTAFTTYQRQTYVRNALASLLSAAAALFACLAAMLAFIVGA